MGLLHVTGLAVRRGGRTVVDEATFEAHAGEVVAVMGASGSGKSTLLRAIAGLDVFDRGSIEIAGLQRAAGRRPCGDEARALYRRVGLVFQFHHLFAHLTVLDNVVLAPVHVLGEPGAAAAARARTLLAEFGVAHRAGAYPSELSGGEAQRVAIARALAVDPPLLLMDEPTASLDADRRADLAAVVRRLCDRGRGVVLATHDADFAGACANRVLTMTGGRLVAEA